MSANEKKAINSHQLSCGGFHFRRMGDGSSQVYDSRRSQPVTALVVVYDSGMTDVRCPWLIEGEIEGNLGKYCAGGISYSGADDPKESKRSAVKCPYAIDL